MKRAVLLIIISALLMAFTAHTASASGDTGWTCPAGTEHSYKLDNLSGPTFTVPAAPVGWEVLGVSIKAGPDHYDYPDARSGDVLSVKDDTYHDVSHAHVCKRRTPAPTTTEVPPSTTTTVPDTTSSTTTTAPPDTSSSTTSTTSAPTTTAPASTSTSSPPSTSTPTTSSVPVSTSTTTSTTTSPTGSSTTTTTGAPSSTSTTAIPSSTSPVTASSLDPRLPATGTTTDMLAAWAVAMLLLGSAALFVVRRPR